MLTIPPILAPHPLSTSRCYLFSRLDSAHSKGTLSRQLQTNPLPVWPVSIGYLVAAYRVLSKQNSCSHSFHVAPRGIWAKPLFSVKTQVFTSAGGGGGTPHFHTGKPMLCMHMVDSCNKKLCFQLIIEVSNCMHNMQFACFPSTGLEKAFLYGLVHIC